jgi:hypothetical protein
VIQRHMLRIFKLSRGATGETDEAGPWRASERRRICKPTGGKELEAGVRHASRDASLKVLASGRVSELSLICRDQKVDVLLVADRYLDSAGLTRYEADAVLG